MKLSPSLRQKKRYVAFEVLAEHALPREELAQEVGQVLNTFLGQWGRAKASPMLLKEKFHQNRFIIKINHQYVDELKAALLLSKKVKNQPVIIRSVITSGTLKKASSYLQK